MQPLKALFINTSLKNSKEPSHTEEFIKDVQVHYNQLGVESEVVRLADYAVAYGVQPDMGEGDEWPQVFEKVMAADIVIIGTPLWLGEKSSLATQTIERLYASSSVTNDKGQSIFYNKVGGVAITGNEDGAKHAAASVLYALSHIGFVVPPNVDAYWVGEAGPGPSYMDTGKDNEFTKKAIRRLAYNTYHFAGMLKNNPIPSEGNTLE
ncbi:MAG: NAD(P)H-dependent oxidoreductase [Planococcus sp. (in: firmicutes)]|uniref:flavodoxin family protein n=1 Tax=Planococcus halocryophilus TaxID=1215089 RepID=UPI001F117E10|nr:NAD(P)H-dependent oxidoreductase [Planococcus halocryophilus]MCH4825995.1 NAD(P)H-dependent oxidoreductase [Planococcus halocryophilus]